MGDGELLRAFGLGRHSISREFAVIGPIMLVYNSLYSFTTMTTDGADHLGVKRAYGEFKSIFAWSASD